MWKPHLGRKLEDPWWSLRPEPDGRAAHGPVHPRDYIRKARLSRWDETLARSDWRAARALPTFLLVPRISLPRSHERKALMSKTWLITGSSRGLGLALARAVLAGGDRLVATARNPEDLGALVSRYGDRVRAVALDVTDAAAARAARGHGRLCVRPPRRRRQQRRLRQRRLHRAHGRRRLPRADRDELLRRRERHARRPSGAARAARRPHHPDLLDRRSPRQPRALARTSRRSGPSKGSPRCSRARSAPLGIRVTIVEPGGIRTDWAGSSMHVDEVARRLQGDRRRLHGQRPQEPRRRARRPGEDGAGPSCGSRRCPSPRCASCSAATPCSSRSSSPKQRAAEDAKWRSLSVSTDFDGPRREFARDAGGEDARRRWCEGADAWPPTSSRSPPRCSSASPRSASTSTRVLRRREHPALAVRGLARRYVTTRRVLRVLAGARGERRGARPRAPPRRRGACRTSSNVASMAALALAEPRRGAEEARAVQAPRLPRADHDRRRRAARRALRFEWLLADEDPPRAAHRRRLRERRDCSRGGARASRIAPRRIELARRRADEAMLHAALRVRRALRRAARSAGLRREGARRAVRDAQRASCSRSSCRGSRRRSREGAGRALARRRRANGAQPAHLRRAPRRREGREGARA